MSLAVDNNGKPFAGQLPWYLLPDSQRRFGLDRKIEVLGRRKAALYVVEDHVVGLRLVRSRTAQLASRGSAAHQVAAGVEEGYRYVDAEVFAPVVFHVDDRAVRTLYVQASRADETRKFKLDILHGKVADLHVQLYPPFLHELVAFADEGAHERHRGKNR